MKRRSRAANAAAPEVGTSERTLAGPKAAGFPIPPNSVRVVAVLMSGTKGRF